MYNKKELRVQYSAKKKQNPFSKDIPVDPKGQWNHMGKPVKIPSNLIDTYGMPGSIMGVPDVGEPQMMAPNGKYEFPKAKMVTEIPMFQKPTDGDFVEVELDDRQIAEYRMGGFVVEDLPSMQDGGLKPRISYTAEQLKEYEDAYTGEEPFMDRFQRESEEMGFFNVMGDDGSYSSYDPTEIHDQIMQHGLRTKQLAKMTGADPEQIKKFFQPSFDYHQASYDVRGRKYLDELIDKGYTKDEAFDELINKKKFGTREGLEKIFSQTYDDLNQYKTYQKEKAQYDKLNAAQGRAQQYAHLTDEQLLAESKKQAGPTVEGANYLAELDRRKFIANQPKQEALAAPAAPLVSDNTFVNTQVQDLQADRLQDFMDYEKRGYSLDGYSPEAEQAAYQAYVKNIPAYNEIGIDIKDFINSNTGDYDYEAFAHAMNNSDNAIALNKNFQQQEQKRYDAAPWYQRWASNTSAFLDDPINVGGNLLSGEGPMLNQSRMRNDPEYLQQVANRYGVDPATIKGQWDNGIIDDIFDYVNPGHWGTVAGKKITDASEQFDQGNYWEGTKDYGEALLNVLPAVPAGRLLQGKSFLPSVVMKTPTYANKVLKANPTQALIARGMPEKFAKFTNPISLNTGLAGTSATHLPSAFGKVWDDPTSMGAWGELALTGLGSAPIFGGGVNFLRNAPMTRLKYAPEGIKNVLTPGNKVTPLDLFRQQPLYQFSSEAKVANNLSSVDKYGKLKVAPENLDKFTTGRWLQTTKNPDLTKYVDELMYTKPGSAAVNKPYMVNNLGTQANNPNRLVNQLAKDRSIMTGDDVPQAWFDEMALTADEAADVRKMLDTPQGYQSSSIFRSNPEKWKAVMAKVPANPNEAISPKFLQRSDYVPTDLETLNPKASWEYLTEGMHETENLLSSSAATRPVRMLNQGFKFDKVNQIGQGVPLETVQSPLSESTVFSEALASSVPEGVEPVLRPTFFRQKPAIDPIVVPRFQDGGISMELDDDKIAEMKAQGYMIVEEDDNYIPDLRLPQMNSRQKKVNPFSFVNSFPMGDDMKGLMIGAGANFMFDTPLKNLRAGFDLSATNVTGIKDGKPVFNKFKVNTPSIKLHYTLPNKKR